MASKVNTRFVLVLMAALIGGGGIVGALWLLSLRNDAHRNVRIGDEAFAAGDFRRARGYYGRAVDKQPSNPEYLRLFEKAVLSITPATEGEAGEFYRDRIGVLKHDIRHHPNDAQAHLRLLRELHFVARQLGDVRGWETVSAAADEMLQQANPNDPAYALGKTYRALGMFRLWAIRSENERSKALRDIEEALVQLPNDDLTWSTVITGQLAILEQMRSEGMSDTALVQQQRLIDEAIAKAVEAVPQGPETAKAQLLNLTLKAVRSPAAVNEQERDRASQRLASLLDVDCDRALLAEALPVLTMMSEAGYERAVTLADRYLEAHPDAINIRLLAARLRFMGNDLDAAQAAAQPVIDAAPLTVSLMAQAQFDLKRSAAALIADVEFRRWEWASPEDKPAHLAAMEKASERLAALVPDAENNPHLLRIGGKIAYARGQYRRALEQLDKVVRRTDNEDSDILMLCAFCLEQVGELGLAEERVSQALALQPGNHNRRIAKASLEFRLGRFEEASKTLAPLPPEVLNDERVRQLADVIAARATGKELGAAEEATTALVLASKLADRGEFESARATMLQALEKQPNDAGLLRGLGNLELVIGEADRAREYSQRALAIEPDNENVRHLQAALAIDDPIQSLRQLHEAVIADPAQRTVSLMTKLGALAGYQEMVARRLEAERNPAGAAKARDIASRARLQANKSAAELETLAPDHGQLIDFKFSSALQAADWATAEKLVAKARSLNLDSADGLTYRGRLEITRGNVRQAIQAFEGATERAPYSTGTWRLLAMACQSQGNLAQAQRALEQAYRCNPSDIPATKAYIEVLQQRGDKNRALEIVRSAKRLAPADLGLRDRWLQLEAEVGNRLMALRERRRIYKENPADRPNAIFLANMLGDTEPVRELLIDAQGNPLYGEQRWVRMQQGEKEAILNRARTEWLRECDSILESLRTSGSDSVHDELLVAVVRANLLRIRGDWSGGERVLEQFIASLPADKREVGMFLELARFQGRGNHYSEAITTLQQALGYQSPQEMEIDRELAGLYMQLGANAQALEHLEKIVAAAPESGGRIVKKQLAECLARLSRFDDADRVLREMTAEGGEDAVMLLLQASVAEGRADKLAAAGDAAGADRRYREQREALARAEKLDPLSPLPSILRAQSFIKDFRRTQRLTFLDDALAALDRAENLRPGSAEVSLIRVAALKEKGDWRGAVGELRRLLERAPDNMLARRELIQIHVEQNEMRAAVALADEAIKINPSLAIWHEAKGDLNRRMLNDFLESRKGSAPTPDSAAQAAAFVAAAVHAFVQADDLAPSTTLLYKTVDTAFAAGGQTDCRGIATRLSKRSADMDAMPVLREFYARALNCDGLRDDAIAQLKTAYGKRREMIRDGVTQPADIENWFQAMMFMFPGPGGPGTVDAAAADQFATQVCMELGGSGALDLHELRAISHLWFSTGPAGLSRAVELQRQAVEKCPADQKDLLVGLHAQLAAYLLVSQNFAEAVAQYEKLLKLDANHLEGLNNIAFLLSEELHEPARALPYAQRALQQAPRSHSVLDTLGWVHYRMGSFDKATDYLLQSIQIERTVTTYGHLAQIAYEQGKLDQSIGYLDEAMKLRPDQQTQQKIQSLRVDIEKKRTAGG